MCAMRPCPERNSGVAAWRERDHAEEVDVEHPPPVGFGHVLHRTAGADARVVHECLQAAVADVVGDPVEHTPHVVAVLHVEDDRSDIAGVLRFQPVAVVGAADAGVDGPAEVGEPRDAGLADSRGRSGDQGVRHSRNATEAGAVCFGRFVVAELRSSATTPSVPTRGSAQALT